MYRKALTKQGSNKRGVKPQHIDMGDKKALETPKQLGEKDTRRGKGVADKIQKGYVTLLYTNRKAKAIQRRSIVVQSMAQYRVNIFYGNAMQKSLFALDFRISR